ncbi:DUF1129 domain-containing protein [Furfurilactobacillus siliginis]|uniref:Membrane protein n=1 Tax=Furfurilactobacillus siliginis TaxID=348151 RepID=A0A0R2LEY2_9LACO|nr:DUF1129 domain-containing protein [Furfurilactobacillus siliginis]KRN97101.1 membrane protein [Furfurilactobacillus siliginis]GEK29601.1 membrane protein [Furfurilactobacillus siliginis]
MSEDNRERNASAKQEHHGQIRTDTSKYNELGLTKRNQEFMYQLNKVLDQRGFSGEKRNVQVTDTLTKLEEGQKTGQTAKQLFGTPTAYAEELINGPAKNSAAANGEAAGYWPTAADSALSMLAIFAGMYGILGFFSKTPAAQAGQMGLLGIILVSGVFGLGWAWLTPMLNPTDKRKRVPLWRILLDMVALLAVILLLFTGVTMLPPVINPVLPPVAYIILALAAFGADLWIRRRFNVVGGMFAGPRNQRR